MNSKKAVFRVATTLLGTGHLVFQSLADACLEAEVQVVKRTGYYSRSGEYYQLPEVGVKDYKKQRQQHTTIVQTMMQEKFANATAVFNKKLETKTEKV